jgi:hypothetical protein
MTYTQENSNTERQNDKKREIQRDRRTGRLKNERMMEVELIIVKFAVLQKV